MVIFHSFWYVYQRVLYLMMFIVLFVDGWECDQWMLKNNFRTPKLMVEKKWTKPMKIDDSELPSLQETSIVDDGSNGSLWNFWTWSRDRERRGLVDCSRHVCGDHPSPDDGGLCRSLSIQALCDFYCALASVPRSWDDPLGKGLDWGAGSIEECFQGAEKLVLEVVEVHAFQ